MKRILCAFVLILLMQGVAWGVTCNVSTLGELQNAADGTTPNCDTIIVTINISVTSSVEVDLASSVEIYGSAGTEQLSGVLGGEPIVALLSNNVTIHDLVITNTSSTASSSAILLANGTSGHEIYDVEFQNCAVSCIFIPGTGVGEFSQNSFNGTTAARAIVYSTATYPAPTFGSASMTSYTAWQLAAATPDSASGDVEFYVASGDDIVPLGSVLTDQEGAVTASQNFSAQLPSGTFYALFTGDSTSDFTDASEATGISVAGTCYCVLRNQGVLIVTDPEDRRSGAVFRLSRKGKRGVFGHAAPG